MKIYIASDHAGFMMKQDLAEMLAAKGYDVRDCGPFEYDPHDDYPDYIAVAAKHVSSEIGVTGIVIGWSGQGEAIVANRFPDVRAAVYYGGSKHVLTLSREHNDANMLSLGAHFLTSQEARAAVELWLSTAFSGDERHVRRIKKIEHLKIKHS